MTGLLRTSARCDPGELLGLLAPGQVVGFYQGSQWIDWNAVPQPGLDILTSDRPARLWRGESQRYHIVMDAGAGHLSPFLVCLARMSKGVALVSSRLGALLRNASRIVAQPAYPQRTSGPFRVRTSGAVLVFREAMLRVVDSAQVLDSATLTLTLPDPARGAAVLESSFPSLQVERPFLHLSVRGHHPEEVLGRLREAGVGVSASAMWYRLLQSWPLKD